MPASFRCLPSVRSNTASTRAASLIQYDRDRLDARPRHPRGTQALPTVIDPASFIAAGALVLGDVQIGADSSVWYYTVIRGDTERIRIGEGTNLQDFTMVHADPGIPCLVGNRVTVGHRVILHGCVVEDECLIGMGAILLNRVKVGTGSVVGAPAKVVRQVDEKARARIDRIWRHYVEQARRHRAGEFAIVPPSTATG